MEPGKTPEIPATSSDNPYAADALRVLRMVQAAMIAAIFAYCFLGEAVGPADKSLGATLYILSAVAMLDAGVVVFIRSAIIPRAEDELRQAPGDPLLWRQWRTTYVIAYAVAESVALFGLLLRLLGASLGRIVPLYVIAAALIFFSSPRLPD